MFHICFATNESYIKYNGVLITSIIKNIDSSKKFKDFFDTKNMSNGGGDLINSNLADFKKQDCSLLNEDEKSEGFIFHILTDKISSNSQNKLQALAKKLNQIYPCEIKVHICDESGFEGLVKWCGNYLAFYRFLSPSLCPQS